MKTIKFGINRMVAPALPLKEFLDMVPETGATGVELRNDLPGFDVVDGLDVGAVRDQLASRELSVFTINAVQHFNLPEAQEEMLGELRRLLGFAGDLDRPAIILCPHNATDDTRSASQQVTDTDLALRTIAPILEDSGVIGLVEPLGFPECSLRSPVVAAEVIGSIGSEALKITLDTFHFAVAGMNPEELGTAAVPAELIGLVHLSGVTADGPVADFRDPDRVYVDENDRVCNLETLRVLLSAGFTGACSFEPFSPVVHGLSRKETVAMITRSMAYIREHV
jgi:2-keto-myo-inositol isomerase